MLFFLSSIFLLFCSEGTFAVIYRLNVTEHDRLPRLVTLDRYDSCLREVGGVYCSADVRLISDQPSEFLDFVKNYSEHLLTHFDHSKNFYGLCVTQTCKEYLNTTERTSQNIHQAVEACLNDTLWDQYQLKGLVDEKVYCSTEADNQVVLGTGEIVVAIMLFTIIALNGVGTLYEIYCTKREIKHRNRLLMSFSIFSNWRKLVAPAAEGPDSRLRRLKGLNGIKTMSAALVIMAHSVLPFIMSIENSFDFEQIYSNIIYQILLNGTLIVQTFFIISGLLMSLNVLIYREKKSITWKGLPLSILHRYWRLTPTYAVILAVMSTWFKYAGSGPFWQKYAVVETEDCKKYWYFNLLYASNFIDGHQCMVHTWYLAADFQLFIVGLILCTLMTTKKMQKISVLCLFALGVIIPGVITYVYDLDALLIIAPETILKVFVLDDTFNMVYKHGHTNLAAYSVGLGTGYLIYYLITNKCEETHQWFKKMRVVNWLTVPMGFASIMMCSIFYADGPPQPLILRSLFAAFLKPFFSFLMSFIIMSCVFKGELLYRGILEWRGFTATGRISYCAFLLHIAVIRGYAGTVTDLAHFSILRVVMFFFGTLIVTFLVAVPLYLMVESPFNELLKSISTPAPRKETNLEKNVVPKNIELVLELPEDNKNKHGTDSENIQ